MLNREAKWVLGIVGGLVILAGVAKVGWWLGARAPEEPKVQSVVTPPTVEPTPAPVAQVEPAPQQPAVAVQQPQVRQQQQRRGNTRQPAQLTPDQQAQLDQQRAAATQRLTQGISNALGNMQFDPNTNTIVTQGPNGPQQRQLPQNVQVVQNPDGSVGGFAVTTPDGQAIPVVGANGINLQGLGQALGQALQQRGNRNRNGGGGFGNNGGGFGNNGGGFGNNGGGFGNGNGGFGNGGFGNGGGFGGQPNGGFGGQVDPNGGAVDPNQGGGQ